MHWLVRLSSVGSELKRWSWFLGTWPQGELGRGLLFPPGVCGSGLVYWTKECSSLALCSKDQLAQGGACPPGRKVLSGVENGGEKVKIYRKIHTVKWGRETESH